MSCANCKFLDKDHHLPKADPFSDGGICTAGKHRDEWRKGRESCQNDPTKPPTTVKIEKGPSFWLGSTIKPLLKHVAEFFAEGRVVE